MEIKKFFGRALAVVGLLVVGALLSGCQSAPPQDDLKFPVPVNGATAPGDTTNDLSGAILAVGNAITVSFADTPTPVQPIDDTVKDDGSITLIYNQKFSAAGKTIGALQTEIRDRYVPAYFKYLTVSIKIDSRFYSVGGEVRAPNRQAYVGKMTVLGAIDTAGGFTDFARRSKVTVTRANGKKMTVNCIKAVEHPELNIEIFPGDRIHVPKRLW